MLHVQLGTLPRELPSPVTLALETLKSIDSKDAGQSIGNMVMPQPGTVAIFSLAVTPVFVLRLVLQFGRDRVGVVLGPLHDGDTLALIGGLVPSLTASEPQVQYSGTVIHAKTQRDGKCGVRCDDGDLVEDECCATCTKNGIAVRVCC